MKASKYIKYRGINAILVECNYNLRNVRNHLLRETDITSDKTSRILREFKELLVQKTQTSVKQELIDEITRKIMKKDLQI